MVSDLHATVEVLALALEGEPSGFELGLQLRDCQLGSRYDCAIVRHGKAPRPNQNPIYLLEVVVVRLRSLLHEACSNTACHGGAPAT